MRQRPQPGKCDCQVDADIGGRASLAQADISRQDPRLLASQPEDRLQIGRICKFARFGLQAEHNTCLEVPFLQAAHDQCQRCICDRIKAVSHDSISAQSRPLQREQVPNLH